ncbi:hypothetical protein Droror1_Dr00017706, partial [Drosera rotundifolia]
MGCSKREAQWRTLLAGVGVVVSKKLRSWGIGVKGVTLAGLCWLGSLGTLGTCLAMYKTDAKIPLFLIIALQHLVHIKSSRNLSKHPLKLSPPLNSPKASAPFHVGSTCYGRESCLLYYASNHAVGSSESETVGGRCGKGVLSPRGVFEGWSSMAYTFRKLRSWGIGVKEVTLAGLCWLGSLETLGTCLAGYKTGAK